MSAGPALGGLLYSVYIILFVVGSVRFKFPNVFSF